MSAFLSLLYSLFHLGFAFLEWGLLFRAIVLWRRSHSVAMILLPAVLAGISYDNFTIALGAALGEGELLKSLNALRFLCHYFFVPFFIRRSLSSRAICSC